MKFLQPSIAILIAAFPLPAISTSVIIQPVIVDPENSPEHSIEVFALKNEPGCANGIVYWITLPVSITEARLGVENADKQKLLSASLEIQDRLPEPALGELQSTLEFLEEGFHGIAFCIAKTHLPYTQLYFTDINQSGRVTRVWRIARLEEWVK